MRDFQGRIAVVTGGASGMGRELVRQLAAEGCHVAMCDLDPSRLEESRASALEGAPAGTRITTHVADVSEEPAVIAFRDAVLREHATDEVHLLFNNAGIGGGGSFINDAREVWEKTFAVCWGGVYHGTRAFLPHLIKADEAHLVNTSSVNGFWACLGPQSPNTAYSAAKFAVKGFSEALIVDLRLNAPHVKVSVVMPGHIGTDIVTNTFRVLAGGDLSAAMPGVTEMGNAFRNRAPTSAAEAATTILDGVRSERWRILVGDDAHALDALVRELPEDAYQDGFRTRLGQPESFL